MRLAVAVWQSRISPVFDTAGQLLVLDIDDGRESDRTSQSIAGLSLQRRVDRLVELDVDVLLCGAISRPLAGMVAASGIRLIPWVTGDAEGVLRWYLTGKPMEPRFLMPGRRRRQRRLGRSHGKDMAQYSENHPEDNA